jgi:DNA primase
MFGLSEGETLMGLIPEDIIAQVLDRSNIVEIISEHLSLKKSGRNFKACCPFHHEKTPSFVVNQDKQIFHCFGCGVGGNVISFVMQQDRIDFPSALRILAQRAGITVPQTREEESSKTKTSTTSTTTTTTSSHTSTSSWSLPHWSCSI